MKTMHGSCGSASDPFSAWLMFWTTYWDAALSWAMDMPHLWPREIFHETLPHHEHEAPDQLDVPEPIEEHFERDIFA